MTSPRRPLARLVLLAAVAGPLLLAACGGTTPASSSASATPSQTPSQTPSPSASPTSESPTAGLLPTPVGDWSEVVGREFVDGEGLILAFTETTIGTSAGCNSMGGSAEIEDFRLIIIDGGLAQTDMACDEELMEKEAWWAEFLLAGPTLTMTMEGDLILTTTEESVTLTDRSVAEPDVELTGVVWTLDGITIGDTVSSVPEGVVSTLEFAADGTVSVQPGCNTGQGGYEVAGEQMTIGPVAVTAMACEGPADEVEMTVLTIIDGTVDFSIDGATLTIMRGDSGLTYRTS